MRIYLSTFLSLSHTLTHTHTHTHTTNPEGFPSNNFITGGRGREIALQCILVDGQLENFTKFGIKKMYISSLTTSPSVSSTNWNLPLQKFTFLYTVIFGGSHVPFGSALKPTYLC